MKDDTQKGGAVPQTIEVDEAVVKAVATEVEKTLEGKIPSADAIAEAIVAKSEKPVKKNISDATDAGKKTVKVLDDYEKLSKEVKFAHAVRAHLNHDSEGVRRYSEYSLKAWAEKSNYQNVTTAADGGALVPDPEFVAEVERLTQEYGVAARLANIRMTDRDSVTLLSGTNEISFTKTNEATAQNATKLTYAASTVSLDKYIATLILTSEIVEDSAIDMFQDAANEIARARAKLIDTLVFTDTTQGLLYAPDSGEAWNTQTVGTAITDFDFDDAMNATYKVVSSVRRKGKFFMHPTVWNALRQKKTGDGTNSAAMYLAGSPLDGVQPRIDGYDVELVDVLPAVGEITANEPFAVFGDLSRVMVHFKRMLETKVFDAGVVKDAGGSDYNLITQDSFAMRATLRCVTQTRFPDAFCIIGTGTVS